MQTMTQTPRTRPLTAKQRGVLEILATGGRILHTNGIRGWNVTTRLFTKDGALVGDIHPAVFRSLHDPFPLDAGHTDPGLVERFTPKDDWGFRFDAHWFRITRAGREALKIQ